MRGGGGGGRRGFGSLTLKITLCPTWKCELIQFYSTPLQLLERPNACVIVSVGNTRPQCVKQIYAVNENLIIISLPHILGVCREMRLRWCHSRELRQCEGINKQTKKQNKTKQNKQTKTLLPYVMSV